jgi:CubicO group peptidase (beta-lactamase class C family)
MLRYSAGLPVDNQFLDNPNRDEVWKLMAETKLEYPTGTMAETKLEYPTGTMVEYSDLTYRLLGRMIEAVVGTDLNKFCHDNIWQPLGMRDTMYNPPAELKQRIAATAKSEMRGYLVRGEVQDEQDFKLGGIVGCDGLFSTTMDIAIFCQMFLNGGTYNGVQILKPDLIAEMVKNQTPQINEADTDTSLINNLILTPKGYGWELFTYRFSSGGMRLTHGVSYGKAGGAGTFMWSTQPANCSASS